MGKTKVMKSRMFKKDYDLGFIDDATIGLVKVEHDSKLGIVFGFLCVIAFVAVIVWFAGAIG